MLFFRYPQEGIVFRHPDRPWWVPIGHPRGVWERGDGRRHKQMSQDWSASDFAGTKEGLAKVGAELAEVDREHPMPVPERLVGQVWLQYGREVMLVGFDSSSPDPYKEHWGDRRSRDWPPENAILVSGPGAPWVPSDYKSPTEK